MALLLSLRVQDVIVALLFIHGNCTAKHVKYLARYIFGYNIEESACEKILLKVANEAVKKLPGEYKPESRFSYLEDDLPGCYSLVDGVPVKCRGLQPSKSLIQFFSPPTLPRTPTHVPLSFERSIAQLAKLFRLREHL